MVSFPRANFVFDKRAGLGYLLGGAAYGVAGRLLILRRSGATWQAACACVLALAYAALAANDRSGAGGRATFANAARCGGDERGDPSGPARTGHGAERAAAGG